MKCTRCKSTNFIKIGFITVGNTKIQRYKCKDCDRKFTGQEKFSYLSNEQKKLIDELYSKKISQREIARILQVHL
jgi:transposase-like protein